MPSRSAGSGIWPKDESGVVMFYLPLVIMPMFTLYTRGVSRTTYLQMDESGVFYKSSIALLAGRWIFRRSRSVDTEFADFRPLYLDFN